MTDKRLNEVHKIVQTLVCIQLLSGNIYTKEQLFKYLNKKNVSNEEIKEYFKNE